MNHYKWLKWGVSPLIALLALYKYSAPDLLNLIVPSKGYTVFPNLVYGKEPRQNLDIYVPDTIGHPATTIVFFYGGSWQTGNKEMYRFVGQAFASKGYITVIVNYRLYPEVYFPAFIQDGAQALTWVHDNIHNYQGNGDNLFLAGHSAGAYIAAMLSMNGEYLTAVHGKLTWIKGTIGIAGPYDFLPFTDAKIKAIFSHFPDKKTQPIHYVHGGLSPFLLITGDKDKQVLPKNTYELDYQLVKAGVRVEKIIYPDIGHVGIILTLAPGFRFRAPLLEDINNFIQQVNQRIN